MHAIKLNSRLQSRTLLKIGISFVILLLLAGALLSNRNLDSVRREREAYFITIHYLAGSILREKGPSDPKNFDDLIRPYDGMHTNLSELFPEGLVYRREGKSFILEEPYAQRVSLFRSDRLIATDKKWPRWERSGEYANKFPEKGPFELPPGYE